MTTVILVIHLIIAVALVAIILLQRSEGGALSGLGGGGGNFGGLMSGRGTANLLTRTTAILATCFIATSLLLAILAGNTGTSRSILDTPAESQAEEPASEPVGPSAPVAN